MDLTAAQKLSLQQGLPIDLTVDQTPCVVVRKDLFELAQSNLRDSLESSVVHDLMEQTLGNDPGLALYQQYKSTP